MHSVTGLHIYYYFSQLCDYQLHRTVFEKKPRIEAPDVLLLLEQGRRNESLYVEQLRAHADVRAIHDGSMEERAEQTLAAMREGVQVIHNGILDGGERSRRLAEAFAERGLALRLRGETDLLVRVDHAPSAFGEWSYRVIDVKSSRTGKFSQMMQVAYYDWLLAGVQEASTGCGAVVVFPQGPAGGPREELFDLVDLEPVLTLFLDEKLPDVLGSVQESLPYRLSRNCRRCLWSDHCRARAESTGDISLVEGVRGGRKQALLEMGIRTVQDLATLSDDRLLTAVQKESLGSEGLSRVRTQALALHENQLLERARFDDVLTDWILENNRRPGDFRDGGNLLQVYVDVRADHLTGMVFGYAIKVGTHPVQFFYAEDAKQEDLLFYRFMEGMQRVAAQTGGRYAILHSVPLLPWRLRDLAERHALPEAVGALEGVTSRLIDVVALLRRAWYFPLNVLDGRRLLSVFLQQHGVADPSGVPRRPDLFGAALLDQGWDGLEVEEALCEVEAAAESLSLSVEQILAAPAIIDVAWRMHVERGHKVWGAVLRLAQSSELATLHTAVRLIELGAKGRTHAGV